MVGGVVVLALAVLAWRMSGGEVEPIGVVAAQHDDVVVPAAIAPVREDARIEAPVVHEAAEAEQAVEEPIEVVLPQPPAFEADPLVEAGIERAVAEQMVAAARDLWKIYEGMHYLPQQSRSMRPELDYFWAVWPELPRHIVDGRIGIDVRRWERQRRNISDGSISFARHFDSEASVAHTFTGSFYLPSFAVTLRFKDSTLLPEVYARATAESDDVGEAK